jgi:cytochrome c oxidase subunit II
MKKMSRLKKLWRLVPLFAVMTFLLTGCGSSQLSALDPRGPVAREQLWLMKFSLYIMLAVMVIVFVLYFYVLIRFRKRKGQTGIPKQVEGNHLLEIVWTVIPIILLVVLAVPTVTYTFKHSADQRQNKDALHVKVTAHQFWWQFEYPDLGIQTAQDLVIPKNKKIALELTSADVTHSFWVPSLAGKVDTNTGLKTILYLSADEVNTFRGKCAELCGASHTLMNFFVVSKEQADFDAWASGLKAPKTVPADAAQGQALFKENCMACHAVDVGGVGAAPNLNGFASRTKIAGLLDHNDANLKRWIQDPNAVKPGNKMGKIPVTDDQINQIVKYLDTLK